MGRVYARGVFERFTERARQVVVLAQDEARALRDDHIGTEHLLLGLMREEPGVAARVLGEAGLDVDVVRDRIRAIVGERDDPSPGAIPFSPGAKAALEAALRESLDVGHNFIGTEHILLGILRTPSRRSRPCWPRQEPTSTSSWRAPSRRFPVGRSSRSRPTSWDSSA